MNENGTNMYMPVAPAYGNNGGFFGGDMGGNSYRGDSYARGRSRMTGRYISRDEGPGYGYNSQDPDGYRRY